MISGTRPVQAAAISVRMHAGRYSAQTELDHATRSALTQAKNELFKAIRRELRSPDG
jgi:hypothetical protein